MCDSDNGLDAVADSDSTSPVSLAMIKANALSASGGAVVMNARKSVETPTMVECARARHARGDE